jgi:phage tail sheath protein FI
MPAYLTPGVYIEETSFRAKAIEGVETSTAGFVGPCRYGPVAGVPALLTSLSDFERLYGDGQPLAFGTGGANGAATSPNFLWHAARSFFDNGGRRLHVSRVFQPLAATAPDAPLPADGRARGSAGGVPVVARHPGSAGNLRVRLGLKLGAALASWAALAEGDVVWVTPTAAASTVRRAQDLPLGSARLGSDGRWQVNGATPVAAAVQLLTVSVETLAADGRVASAWSGMWPNGARGVHSLQASFGAEADAAVPVVVPGDAFADGLAWVQALASGLAWQLTPAEVAAVGGDERLAWRRKFEAGVTVTVQLAGGNDGQLPGAAAWQGGADPATGLKALEAVDDVALVAAPGSTWHATQRRAEVAAITAALIAHAERMRYRFALLDSPEAQTVSEVRDQRRSLDSRHAALYYPWVTVTDPLTAQPLTLPPSGFVAGICARVDQERGVWKAPANEVVRGALGFERAVTAAEQDVLNPEGINCLRAFAGRGLRVWGARTISSDPEWQYVNQRRYVAYLEHSMDLGTQWAVFEPNGEALWARVRQSFSDFLFGEWTRGALLGLKPEQAFFVRCDRTTMTQNDLDNGRLVAMVGVAMVKPAEFVILRIGQQTADAKA